MIATCVQLQCAIPVSYSTEYWADHCHATKSTVVLFLLCKPSSSSFWQFCGDFSNAFFEMSPLHEPQRYPLWSRFTSLDVTWPAWKQAVTSHVLDAALRKACGRTHWFWQANHGVDLVAMDHELLRGFWFLLLLLLEVSFPLKLFIYFTLTISLYSALCSM